MNRDNFFKKIDSFNDELINLRRHIHAHPELSGLENQTAILISGFLKKIGWNVRESIGKTGVIADFGPLDKGIIGLRVDMDALPIFEETQYGEYYGDGGHYTWHTDAEINGQNNGIVRKISVSILLNDPSEFDGGDFELLTAGRKAPLE